MSRDKSPICCAYLLAMVFASACDKSSEEPAAQTPEAAAEADRTSPEAAEPEPEAKTESAAKESAEAKLDVDGSLDKELIRRVTKAHIPEVRNCYDQALAEDPKAAGRVAIGFVIAEDGTIRDAVAEEDTVGPAVAECIRARVATWVFPKPQGGTVKVTYPFVLEPG